jgi:hypothetical protein
MINFGISWCLTHISKNNFVESKVVMTILVGTIVANLENQSLTTRMVSIPFHSGSWVWNPWRYFPLVHSGSVKVYIVHIYFLYVDFMFWHLTQMRTKCSMTTFVVRSPWCLHMGTSCSSSMIFVHNFLSNT